MPGANGAKINNNKIVHVYGGGINGPLVQRVASGIGSSKGTHMRPSVLIMPWTEKLNVPASAKEINFQRSFTISGDEHLVSAFTVNLGPPDAILLKSPLFGSGVFGRKNLGIDFTNAYIFSRCVVELIRMMEMPFPLVSCHGTETGLIPYLIKSDRDLAKEKVLFTAHHELLDQKQSSKNKDEQELDLDFALFPAEVFDKMPGLQLILSEGRDLFYEGQISILKTGIYFADIAFMLHSHLLNNLFASDPTPTNFFRKMVETGRLTYLLGKDEVDLDHAKKAKKIVDFTSEASDLIGKYRYSIGTSRKALQDGENHLLIHTSPQIGENDEVVTKALLPPMGRHVSSNVTIHPAGEHGPAGSGSAILYMLKRVSALQEANPDLKKPVIHLNPGKEKLQIGGLNKSLSEIALRQAAFIFPQLSNGKQGWTLVMGNTTIFIPEGRLMSGASIARHREAGIMIFGQPVMNISKRSDAELKIISNQWGVIFADSKTGEVFSIRENPSVGEIRKGAELSGGDMIFINLSNYAIRDDVRKKMIDLYAEGHGLTLAEEFALHFIGHVIEPMMLSGDRRLDWRGRVVEYGKDVKGKQFPEVVWDDLFSHAQELKRKFGKVVLVHGKGVFADLRSKGKRDELAAVFDGKGENLESRVIRDFFEIASKVPEAEELLELTEELPAAESITGIPSVPVERDEIEVATPLQGMELLDYTLRHVLGDSRYPMVERAIEGAKERRITTVGQMTEYQMMNIALNLKLAVLNNLTEWDQNHLAQDFIKFMPRGSFEEIPVDVVIGLFNHVEGLSQRAFNENRPQGEWYEHGAFPYKFFVVVEDESSKPQGRREEQETKLKEEAHEVAEAKGEELPSRISVNLNAASLPQSVQEGITNGWVFKSLGNVVGIYQISIDSADPDMEKF